MKPKSERVEMHNNYIDGFFQNNSNQEEISNMENTNNVLLSNNHEFLLNKKIVKGSPDSIQNKLITKNNSVQLKNNIINDDASNIDKDKWFRNKLKVTRNMQERKIIYNLESDNSNNNITQSFLSAYKDNGMYVIFKYINSNRNYDKETKAKIKWNMFSNHFKTYDNNNKIIQEIIYNFNFKGWNGPTKLQILIPFSNRNILTKKGMRGSTNMFMHKLENKSPEYSSIYKCYVLNFINRKVIPNEKNLQIIYSDLKEDKNNILLQFAQVETDEYILDYKYPFNNITALSLALTTLSSRMFYQ